MTQPRAHPSASLSSIAVILLFLLAVTVAGTRAMAQCDRSWVPAPNGVNGRVRAVVTWDPDGPGSAQPVLVVGGAFTVAGDVGANHVGYWDGFLWHALGTGLDGDVYALAVVNGQLFAGGTFLTTNGTSAPYLAKWNGSSWISASFGTNGPVYALAANGSELLVGGSFSRVGGTLFEYRYFARLAGSSWSRYAADPPHPVSGLIAYNGTAAAILSDFNSNTNQTSYYLYRWNGSLWDYLAPSAAPSALVVTSTSRLLYSRFVSHFCNGVDRVEYSIGSYDGTSLSAYPDALFHRVTSFLTFAGQIYACGDVFRYCALPPGPPSNGPWLGVLSASGTWTDLTPTPPESGILGVLNSDLYVAGSFQSLESVGATTGASNIARRFSTTTWLPLSCTFDAAVRTSLNHNGVMYVGGDFTHSGTTTLGHAAFFNGTVWVNAVTTNGPITHMTFYSTSDLFGPSYFILSGPFTQVNSSNVSFLAQRDPSTLNWTSLGSGVNGAALATCTLGFGTQVNLIVGGQFTVAGGLTVNRIARWNGSAWSGFGTGMNGDVRALAIYNNQVVAAGSFTTAGGGAASRIAMWNGSSWVPLGSGFNGTVRALVVLQGLLYAGGDFTTAGGAPAAHLASWNGSSWSQVGGGVNGVTPTVNALARSGTVLLVGGNFTQAGTSAFNNIAQWNGTQWTGAAGPPNSVVGTDGTVNTILVAGNDMCAGGSFTYANGQYSPFVARALFPGQLTASTQPVNTAACPGRDATFTFIASSSSWFLPVDYNWFHNGTPINDGPSPSGSTYTHAHTSTLLIENVRPGDAGGYSCVASTDCNDSLTSNGVLLTVGGLSCCGSADFNCDGDLGTDADIEAFFACLSGACPPPPCTSNADFNADGDLGTDSDIEAFFRVLGGGTC